MMRIYVIDFLVIDARDAAVRSHHTVQLLKVAACVETPLHHPGRVCVAEVVWAEDAGCSLGGYDGKLGRDEGNVGATGL